MAPEAVKAAELPEQIVELFTATVGVAFTVTVATLALGHPLDIPVTV